LRVSNLRETTANTRARNFLAPTGLRAQFSMVIVTALSAPAERGKLDLSIGFILLEQPAERREVTQRAPPQSGAPA
jgi:hypothetical protein